VSPSNKLGIDQSNGSNLLGKMRSSSQTTTKGHGKKSIHITAHQLLIYRNANVITNLFQIECKLIQIVFNMTSYAACPSSQQKENKHATTHIAKVDTVLSPKLGVTQEGHCQPGTDPTPQTSQKEQKLAKQNYPWVSQRS
jgi:hypothetical protein